MDTHQSNTGSALSGNGWDDSKKWESSVIHSSKNLTISKQINESRDKALRRSKGKVLTPLYNEDIYDDSILPKGIKIKNRHVDQFYNRNYSQDERVWGIWIMNAFVSVSQLKKMVKERKHLCERIDYKVCKGVESRLDDKVHRNLLNYDLSIMLDAVLSKIQLGKPQSASDNVINFIACSYGVMRILKDEVFPLCLPKAFVMEFILLISNLISANTWPHVFMLIDDYVLKSTESEILKEVFAEVISSIAVESRLQGVLEDICGKLFAPMMEAFATAIICKILGISSEFASLKQITMYIRDNVLKTAVNVMEFISSVFKILCSGSFEDFWLRVYANMGGSEINFSTYSTKLVQLSDEAEDIRPIYLRIMDAENLMAEVALYMAKIDAEDGSRQWRQYVVFQNRVNHLLARLHAIRDSTEVRKEPLGFMFSGDAGTGKSTGIQMIMAAYGSVTKLRPEIVKEQTHTWALDSQFQEGYNNGKKLLYWDEFASVNNDIDLNLAGHCNSLLAILSAHPAWVNMAFAMKGKVTTAAVVGVVVNTNSPLHQIRKLFAGNGENVVRRFIFVTVIPQGRFNVKGRLKVPDGATAKEIAENIIYKFYEVEVEQGVSDEIIQLFAGNFYESTEFVGKMFYDRLYGKDKAVSKAFGELTSYRFDVSKLDKKVNIPKIIKQGEESKNSVIEVDDLGRSRYYIINRYTGWKKEVEVLEYHRHLRDYDDTNTKASTGASKGSTLQSSLGNTMLFSFWTVFAGYFCMKFSYLHATEDVLGMQLDASVWMYYLCPRFLQVLLLERCFGELPMKEFNKMPGVEQLRLINVGVTLGSAVFLRYAVFDFVRNKFNEFRTWLHHHEKELFYTVGVASLAGLTYVGVKKIVEISSSKKEDISNLQVFSMPIKVNPADFPDIPMEMRSYGNDLFQVKREDPRGGVVRRLGVTGPTMTMSDLDKIRSNSVVVHCIRPDGKLDRVFGDRVGAYVATNAHLLPPDLDEYTIIISDPRVPGMESTMVYKKEHIIFRKPDRILLPSVLPGGCQISNLKKSVLRTIQSPTEVMIGKRVVMLGFKSDADVFGTIADIRVRNYDNGSHKFSAKVCVVTWDDKDFKTLDGMCSSRYFLVEGGGYSYCGYHLGDSPCHNGEFVVETKSEIDSMVQEADDKGLSCLQGLLLDDTPPFFYPQDFEVKPIWPVKGAIAYIHTIPGFDQHVLGIVPNQTSLRKTELKRSPFYSKVDKILDELKLPKYCPAELTNCIRYDDTIKVNREVSPFTLGLTRYVNPKIIVKYDVYKLIVSKLCDISLRYVTPNKVLNIDECLLGRECMPPVNITTGASEAESGKKGSFMFEYLESSTGERRVMLDDRMRTSVNTLFLAAANNLLVAGKTSCNLKDEVVTVDKFNKVGTRVFEAECFSIGIIYRMFCGDSKKNIYKFINYLGGALGINVSSPEWKNIVAKAVRSNDPSEIELALDFSKMDKRVLYQYLIAAIYVLFFLVCKCLGFTGEKSKLLARLMSTHLCIIRIIDGAVVIGYIGNPSGCFFTVEYNTLLAIMYLATVFLYAGFSWDEFEHNVLKSFRFYGDDIIGKMTSAQLHRVSLDQISIYMEYLNQKITGVGVVKGGFNQTNFTFLKRNFVEGPDGRVYASLEVGSLLKSLLFYRPLINERADWARHVGVLLQAWGESFFHVSDVKRMLRKLILDCVLCLPIEFRNIRFPSDEELLARFDAGTLKIWELENVV